MNTTHARRSYPLFFLALALPSAPLTPSSAQNSPELPAIVAAPGAKKPPFQFSPEDARVLDEVQRGAFRYLWEKCDPTTGMVYDRSSKVVISVGGVGFQLAAIPVGVEHGWVTKDEGRERAERILKALMSNPRNRWSGLFFHYLDGPDASPSQQSYESVVSTIDSALLFAGALTAGAYFGEEVGALADKMIEEANWRAFVPQGKDVGKPSERGAVSLAWKPSNPRNTTGPGDLVPYYWLDAADEQRLVLFLGACAPREEHRLAPEMYYKLRRALGRDGDSEPFVWFPWSGALFTAFFAHCFIDYASLGADDPAAFGVSCRARVDWWENSRRIVAMHRRIAVDDPARPATMGVGAWGLSASDSEKGYLVPGLFPRLWGMEGCKPEFDFSPVEPPNNFGDGTLAPYAAGSAIMFDPDAALGAMRFYRSLTNQDGHRMVWRALENGGYGFQDSFNTLTGWVAPDCVAIDQGPLLLAIENARTGNVWRWFGSHGAIKQGFDRLKLTPVSR